MEQVIIGAGEVGTALAKVLSGAHLRDIEPTGPDQADVLHVCLRWSDDFTRVVKRYEQQYLAELVIVHSTVPAGTCDQHGWVHSPIRGRHPDLEEGIRRFVKHFGGLGADEAAEIFEDVGVRTHVTDLAVTTESGKLWELVQYGVQVAVEKAIYAECERTGADFDTAYTEFARTYNDGYADLGYHQFIRPVLAHVPGPIGGHCVVQNAAMLEHPLADLVIRASTEAEKEVNE